MASIMKPTILVLGASGTVGSFVVKALLNRNVRILAAVHSNPEKAASLGVEVVKVDVNNPASIATAMKNVDKLFILNPNTSQVAEQTSALVNAAKSAGVSHIVRMGGIDSEKREIALARWHDDADKEVKDSGIAYTLIHPNNFMSNFAVFMTESIKSTGTFYSPWGEGRVSWIDPEDIGEIIAHVLTTSGHAGKTYNVTGPESLSPSEIAQIFSTQLGRKVNYVDVPAAAAKEVMLKQGVPQLNADALAELSDRMSKGYMGTISDHFEKVLGRKPHTFSRWLASNLLQFKE